ncbi:DUF6221 family protein [Nonomuraea sp. NPDC005650]|uniref:DUF6221 family protein n=1 Tax=Nonomuraea sp. NPDC005650 TaxID=3157045 RepID=UPI0033A2830D
MDELFAFVHARLDEDEAVALTSCSDPACGVWAITEDGVDFDQYEVGGFHPATAAHIARHDPARTLRDVQARRATLVRCQREMLAGIPRLAHFAKMTVWEMAQRWKDRETFKEGWKP